MKTYNPDFFRGHGEPALLSDPWIFSLPDESNAYFLSENFTCALVVRTEFSLQPLTPTGSEFFFTKVYIRPDSFETIS